MSLKLLAYFSSININKKRQVLFVNTMQHNRENIQPVQQQGVEYFSYWTPGVRQQSEAHSVLLAQLRSGETPWNLLEK